MRLQGAKPASRARLPLRRIRVHTIEVIIVDREGVSLGFDVQLVVTVDGGGVGGANGCIRQA